MRTTIVAVVALMLIAAIFARVEHHCIHDTPEIQNLMVNDLKKVSPQRRAFRGMAASNIRILPFYEDVNNVSQICTKAGILRPDFKGNLVTCLDHDVVTDNKKTFLMKQLMPKAIEILSSAIKLEPLTSNLIVGSGVKCSGGFTIPSSHYSTGVANADYLVYVAIGPTPENNLAWAAPCALDNDGRPVLGRVNFGPRYLDTNPNAFTGQLMTAVHEMMHALGFSSGFIKGQKETTLRGKSVTLVTTSTVVDKYRSYIGCTTAEGPELEDEGGSGSRGSHWDRRVLKDELMAAAGGETLSEMTLAAMQDLGLGYTANFAAATSMKWAKNAGCSFINEKCSTTAGGMGTWFCNDQTRASVCTTSHMAYGTCTIYTYTSDLPSYFQYFSDPKVGGDQFLDYCPTIRGYSNGRCNEVREATSNELNVGHYFGVGGRCAMTTNLVKTGLSITVKAAQTPRCLRFQCIQSNSMLQVKTGDAAWVNCPDDTEVSIEGYDGKVVCPKASVLCPIDAESETLPATVVPVEITEPPPTAAPTAGVATQVPSEVKSLPYDTAAQPYTAFTVQGKIGGSYSSLEGATNYELALVNALRMDIGNWFGIGSSRIRISEYQLSTPLSLTFELLGKSVDYSAKTINETLGKIRDEPEKANSNFQFTRNVYEVTVGSDTSVVLWISGGVPQVPPGDNSFCGSGTSVDTCFIIIIILVFGTSLVLLFFVCCCCCCDNEALYTIDMPEQPVQGEVVGKKDV